MQLSFGWEAASQTTFNLLLVNVGTKPIDQVEPALQHKSSTLNDSNTVTNQCREARQLAVASQWWAGSACHAKT